MVNDNASAKKNKEKNMLFTQVESVNNHNKYDTNRLKDKVRD